jgi:hypothetical protein
MVTPQRAKSAAKTTALPAQTRRIKSYLNPPENVNRPSVSRSNSNRSAATPSLQDRIEQRAYDFYLRRGCADGLDQFDWTVAETYVNLENAASQSRPSKSRLGADLNDLEAEIQKKAFALYEKRGYAHGNADFDWNLARELVYLKNRIQL